MNKFPKKASYVRHRQLTGRYLQCYFSITIGSNSFYIYHLLSADSFRCAVGEKGQHPVTISKGLYLYIFVLCAEMQSWGAVLGNR